LLCSSIKASQTLRAASQAVETETPKRLAIDLQQQLVLLSNSDAKKMFFIQCYS